MDRFRYRQHLSGELSHYAADCWDAETEIGGDWVEVTGFAYRGSYDLDKHADHSGESFSVFKQYDEPVTVEQPTVDPDMSELGPTFGGVAADIADALAGRAERDPDAFAGETVSVEVDDQSYDVPVEHTGFAVETVTESGEHVTPHVVEPSFGLGRLVYTVLVHAYRADEVDGDERQYLAVPPAVAPTTVGVFPLMDRDGLDEYAREVAGRLRSAGLSVTYDDAGAIGRRYRRQDEVGTPFCVTVDYDTLEADTVTIRERDSTDQRRVPTADLAETVRRLRDGDLAFDQL
jgi:glycyl-tRNA synthetase (EC 6.1.1.14)